jgi:CubicO group peptidase (beta-lactamase class C family)
MAKDTAWLAPALDYVQQWLSFQMRLSGQPGCALAVAHRGEVILDTALGFANALTGEKLTPKHRFRVASHSKSFTAAAVMRLREQGRLSLDDQAGKYVSGLHPTIAKATIAQLLSHTAGIVRDGSDASYWEGRGEFLNEGALRRDLKRAPIIDAGSRLKYSNHGFGLAGLMIEAITGKRFNDVVAREVVKAADLKNTSPDAPLLRGAKLAGAHSGRLLLGERVMFKGDQSTHALAAATGFVSTASDLVKFFDQLDPAAPRSFLSAASRREMTHPRWRDEHSAIEAGYGLGIITGSFAGWDWFGHSGGFQGYLTRTVVVPKHEIAVSLLMNAADAAPAVWSDGVLHILSRFQQEGPPTRRTRNWTGRWWSLWGTTDLVPMGDKVLMAIPSLPAPFLKVGELAITGRDSGKIALAGAFGNHGEPVRRVRKGGKVVEVRPGSGRLVPEAFLAKETRARYAKPRRRS